MQVHDGHLHVPGRHRAGTRLLLYCRMEYPIELQLKFFHLSYQTVKCVAEKTLGSPNLHLCVLLFIQYKHVPCTYIKYKISCILRYPNDINSAHSYSHCGSCRRHHEHGTAINMLFLTRVTYTFMSLSFCFAHYVVSK